MKNINKKINKKKYKWFVIIIIKIENKKNITDLIGLVCFDCSWSAMASSLCQVSF